MGLGTSPDTLITRLMFIGMESRDYMKRSGGSVKTIALGHGTRVTDAFLGTTEVTDFTDLV